MRITDSIIYQTFLNRLQMLNSDFAKYNEQITTGKRINRPSDDAVANTTLLSMKSELANLYQYVKNIESSERRLEATDSRLNDATTAFTRVLQLVEQAANEPSRGIPREGIAREIEAITQQLLGHADAAVGGRFIFAGTRTTRESLQAVTNNPDGRVYTASSVEIRPPAGSSTTFTGSVPDPRLFNEHIYEIHFIDGSGNYEVLDREANNAVVTTGTISAVGDTISAKGVVYTYTGGPLPTADERFTVLPQYAYNGTSDRMEMQVDENVSVIQNVPGTDPFGGTEPTGGTQNPGGTIFDDLVEFRLALYNDDIDEILNSLTTLRADFDELGRVRANMGGRISNLRDLNIRSSTEAADLLIQIAHIENVNLPEAITEMVQTQGGLQAALQAGAMIGNLKLFDFLS